MADDSDARPSSSDFDHEELDRNLEMGYSSGSGSEYLPDSAPPSRPRTPAAFGHTAVPEEEAASPQTSGNGEEEERASSCLRHEMRQCRTGDAAMGRA